MNKAYVIAPAVLIGGFLAVHLPAERRIEAAAQAHAAQVIATRLAEDAQRVAAQEQAAAAARERMAENERLDRLKAEARQQAHSELMHRLDDKTVAQRATNEGLAQELAALDGQLADIRSNYEATNRAVFDLSKKVELQRADRRLADLEFQRLASMLALRVTVRTMPETPAHRPGPTP